MDQDATAYVQDLRLPGMVHARAPRWAGCPAQAGPGKPARGRGFAFARYKNLAAYCALALEVARETGWIRIVRAVAAVDCGEVVNPDGVRNQIGGGIIQFASWSLPERVRFDDARVLTRDWAGYPILRFGQVPDRVEVHLVDLPLDRARLRGA